MPLPKRRHSNARTRKRRTHYKLTSPELTECPNPRCRQLKRAHQVCPACGFYGSGPTLRRVIDVTKKEKPEEEA